MDINELKLKDIFELKELFSGFKEKGDHYYKGRYVIVRSYNSGIHFGILNEYDPSTCHVQLYKSRRLWRWVTTGASISEIANDGVLVKSRTTNNESKICQELPEIIISNIIEIIPCSEKAIKNISEFAAYESGA